MKDILIVVVLLVILGAACVYIYKAKKRGAKCIGCPYAETCGRKACKEKDKQEN